MKVRCTNSACRKEFRDSRRCPYCGKAYPRLTAKPQKNRESHPFTAGKNWSLGAHLMAKKRQISNEAPETIILDSPGPAEKLVIRTLRGLGMKLSTRKAKRLFRSCPSVLAEHLAPAEASRWVRALWKAGAEASTEFTCEADRKAYEQIINEIEMMRRGARIQNR